MNKTEPHLRGAQVLGGVRGGGGQTVTRALKCTQVLGRKLKQSRGVTSEGEKSVDGRRGLLGGGYVGAEASRKYRTLPLWDLGAEHCRQRELQVPRHLGVRLGALEGQRRVEQCSRERGSQAGPHRAARRWILLQGRCRHFGGLEQGLDVLQKRFQRMKPARSTLCAAPGGPLPGLHRLPCRRLWEEKVPQWWSQKELPHPLRTPRVLQRT